MALPPSAIVIRVATMADADILSRFAARVFFETFAATAAAADMDAYLRQSYGLAIQAEEIADPPPPCSSPRTQVPRAALVGYAHLCVEEASSIELKRIYVDAGWQGRGLAKRLLDEVVGAAGPWHGAIVAERLASQ